MFKNLYAKWLALVAFALVALSVPSTQAAVDTDLAAVVTDMTTYFTSIKALVLVVVIFGIGISYAKFLKRR